MSKKRDTRQAERIGKELVNLRARAGFMRGKTVTQKMVAEEIGINQAAISQYEHGKRIPQPDILDKMYDLYGKEKK